MRILTAHLLFGPPGSGKSTLAEQLGVVVVSRDKERAQMRRGDPAVTEHVIWAKVLRDVCAQLAQGNDVALDATLSNPKRRLGAALVCKAFGADIWLYKPNVSLEECQRRNALRDGLARLNDEEVERLYNDCAKAVIVAGVDGIDCVISF